MKVAFQQSHIFIKHKLQKPLPKHTTMGHIIKAGVIFYEKHPKPLDLMEIPK